MVGADNNEEGRADPRIAAEGWTIGEEELGVCKDPVEAAAAAAAIGMTV